MREVGEWKYWACPKCNPILRTEGWREKAYQLIYDEEIDYVEKRAENAPPRCSKCGETMVLVLVSNFPVGAR